MAWRIELSPAAQKGLRALDPVAARRLLAFLKERIVPLEDPRVLGEALTGSRLGAFWKYRVGDYRIICAIEDGDLLVLVVRIGNRREVYR
ncbi:MAG: type II toxin-antitoxin system RelE/ParE family toxin [Holophaga sp.]|nr:type II toxin-antitoxin system RelE/ParE family toxin [Holophaga sp.]